MTRLGTVLSIGDPVMAELAAQAFDVLWIDLEHGALSARDAQVLALAVQSTGAQALVRVPSMPASRTAGSTSARASTASSPRASARPRRRGRS